MKKYLLLFLAVTFSSQSFASDIHSAFSLKNSCEITREPSHKKNIHDWGREMFCTGYIAGSIDMMNLNGQKCIPEKATYQQIVEVFLKYTEEHPEKLHLNMLLVLTESIGKAFKCRDGWEKP